jgi:hypothetical protein
VVQDVVILQNTYRGAYTRPVGVCTVLRNMAFSMAFVFMSTSFSHSGFSLVVAQTTFGKN